MSNHFFHVIKDPVHGTMQFTNNEDSWIKPFIDSPHFQRLRHIKQLGLGDFIFPGAVHTRFSHSIGCRYVASQIAHKIGLNESDRQLVMIACLLHDIGHGPFSHTFEGIFVDKLVKHEDWTLSFLNAYRTDEFFYIYKKQNPHHPIDHAKFDALANMIMHQGNEKNVLADIVSSQLDADRLDYLLRDSHFCGVQYGEYDFRWMIHCMTIINHSGEKRLGITHKGIGVVEHYLMARRLMTRNIYYAQKCLALEHFLVQFLGLLAQSIDSEPMFASIKETRLGRLLKALHQLNEENEKTEDQKNLKNKFIQDQFIHYQSLCDYDIYQLIRQLAEKNSEHSVIQLAKRLQERNLPKIIRIDKYEESARNIILEFKQNHSQYADWQIAFIESPHQSYRLNEDPILVKNEQGKIKPIHEYSFMIEALSDKLEHVALVIIDKKIITEPQILKLIKKLESTIH